MSQQQPELSMNEVISEMSNEGMLVLAQIGASWVLPPTGRSNIYYVTLIKMLNAEHPWSLSNIITPSVGGQSRNGVMFTLEPMMLKYNLVERDNYCRVKRYMLTDLGREVFKTMLYSCDECNGTRECNECWMGIEKARGRGPGDHQLQVVKCEKKDFVTKVHNKKTCTLCNEFGSRLCRYCKGANRCLHCKKKLEAYYLLS